MKGKLEEVLRDLISVAIFKEYLRSINASEYISAWASVNQMMRADHIDRHPLLTRFKKTYVNENSSRQLFIDYDLRTELAQVKIPSDDVLSRLQNVVLTGLEDGYVNMMSDPAWKKRYEGRSPPHWTKRRKFKKLSRRESDELLIQCFHNTGGATK